MTVLDQAFIKAYTTQHDAISSTVTSQIASPVLSSEAFAGGTCDQTIGEAEQRGSSSAASCPEGESPSDSSAGKPEWPASPVTPTRQAAPTVEALAIPPLESATVRPAPNIPAPDVRLVDSDAATEASVDGKQGAGPAGVTPRFSRDWRPSLDDGWSIRAPDFDRASDADRESDSDRASDSDHASAPQPPEEPLPEDLLLRATPSSCFPPPQSKAAAAAEDTTKTKEITETTNLVLDKRIHPTSQADAYPQADPARSQAAGGHNGISAESSDLASNQVRDGGEMPTFRPALHVDRFAWPPNCSRLSRVAAAEVNRLADSIILGTGRGQKVVALVGVAPRQGCTTLALCAAKRLAERGLNVAIIDADAQRPLLAAALGLLPEVGWEDVLAGRLPLDEVVIESDHDHLAVVPFRGSQAGPGYLLKSPSDPTAALRLLRDQYDLVLVDLGHFAEDETSPLVELIQPMIDSAVLVQNVRSAYSGSLDKARRRLSSAGIFEAGVAENFV